MGEQKRLLDELINNLKVPLSEEEVKKLLLQYGRAKEWAEKLDGCDLIRTRYDISRSMVEMRKEAEERGGSYYISPEFSSTLKHFYSDPTFATAVNLLEVVEAFLPMFQFNSPRNPLYEFDNVMFDRYHQVGWGEV